MANSDEMLAVAGARAEDFAAPGLNPRPRCKVAVLACMDTRIDLFAMLGLVRTPTSFATPVDWSPTT
jgi:hypothetical protein